MKTRSTAGIARLTLCVFTSAILAACGGGSGGSTAPSSSGATTSSPTSGSAPSPQAIALVQASPGAFAAFSAQGSFLPDSLNYMNAVRQSAGLPALISNPAIAQAAQNHAVYEVDNGTVTHTETSGQPGFTGADPTTRVNQYYASALVGEVTTSAFIVNSQLAADSTLAIQDLVNAPFHRANMLYCYSQTGVGSATTTPIQNAYYNSTVYSEYLNIDFADAGKCGADNQIVAYPYSGQTAVNPVWENDEAENPLAGALTNGMGVTVGYPVTIQGFDQAAFTNVNFTITDPTGFVVPCAEYDTSNNSANAQPLMMAVCTPLLELATNTTYTVKVTGNMSNASFASTPFTLQWSFTTATTANVPNTTFVAPALSGSPSQPIDGLASTSQAILNAQYTCAQTALANSQSNTTCNYAVNPGVVSNGGNPGT